MVSAPGGEPLGDGARVREPRSPGSGQLTPLAAARTPSAPVGAATSRDRKPSDRVARRDAAILDRMEQMILHLDGSKHTGTFLKRWSKDKPRMVEP